MMPSSVCALLSVLLLASEAYAAHFPVKDTEASKAPQPKALLSKGPILAKVQVAEKAGQSSTGVPVTMIHEVAKVSTKTVGAKTVEGKTVVTNVGAANEATASTVGTNIAVANMHAAKTAAGTNVEVNMVVAKKDAGKTVATKAAVAAKTVAAKLVTAKTASTHKVVTKVVVAKTVAAETVVKNEPNQSTNIMNKTKAVEEAVVSLPMASFALGDTKAVIITNTPPKKNTVEASKAVVPKATGTFSLSPPTAADQKAHEFQSGVKSDKPSAKFMASKVSAPTQPIKNNNQAKEMPAPIPVKPVAAEPPQTEEEDEIDMDALKAISQAYQHKPAG